MAAGFDEAIEYLTAELRASGLSSTPVLYPGEPELMRKAENGTTFAAPVTLWHSLADVSAKYGVALPQG